MFFSDESDFCSTIGIIQKNMSKNLFKLDLMGRTTLFYMAGSGDIEAVKQIIYSLSGTGMNLQRLSLINIKDVNGQTAIDMAEQAGHQEIVNLLRSEKGRMEFLE